MSFSTINMTPWVAVLLYYVVFMNIPATLKLIHCLHIHAYLWYMHKQAAQSSLAIKKITQTLFSRRISQFVFLITEYNVQKRQQNKEAQIQRQKLSTSCHPSNQLKFQ